MPSWVIIDLVIFLESKAMIVQLGLHLFVKVQLKCKLSIVILGIFLSLLMEVLHMDLGLKGKSSFSCGLPKS